MHEVFEKLGKIGIVPVVTIDDAEKALPLAHALIAGGIPCAEITFRTAGAEEAIRRICRELPEMLTGAGTVLSIEQADRAIGAGARFVVSPGFNPRVVAHCRKQGVPVIPGCSTPTDIEAALEAGLDVVKFFPAESSGGLSALKALAAPFPSLKFMPTGGISAANIGSYLAYEKILACGGSWMVKEELIKAGSFDTVSALCKDAVRQALGYSAVHVGINTENEDEARKAAVFFESVFGFPPLETGKSFFAGEGIEIMKFPGQGRNGHIAIGVNSVALARAHLERAGLAFKEESATFTGKGRLTLIYLSAEIAGFAIHLVQKKEKAA